MRSHADIIEHIYVNYTIILLLWITLIQSVTVDSNTRHTFYVILFQKH